MNTVALDIANATHVYARTGWRLGPLSVGIRGGCMTGLIGPNGSGKSTLLSLLSRRVHYQGTVTLFDRCVRSYTAREWAQTVAYLPQRIGMDYEFSVEETVAFGRFPHTGLMGFLGQHDRDVVERCLQETELTVLRGRLLSEVSGGERQRAHLAAVLAQEPRILFLDEPTTALDIHHQISFHALLRSCADSGITIVLATHDLTLAAQFCDDLVLLANGAIACHGVPDEVLREDLVQSVYGSNVSVLHHPTSGRPMVVPAS